MIYSFYHTYSLLGEQDGWTALIIAADSGNHIFLSRLLEAGANVDISNNV